MNKLFWRALGAWIWCAASLVAAPAPPNILFIMTDDHAAHALSCYGSVLNQTPSARQNNLFMDNDLPAPLFSARCRRNQCERATIPIPTESHPWSAGSKAGRIGFSCPPNCNRWPAPGREHTPSGPLTDNKCQEV